MVSNSIYRIHPVLDQILANWEEHPKQGALMMIGKYGLPREATISRLIWYNNGPWKQGKRLRLNVTKNP
jgi:hypothetical protein